MWEEVEEEDMTGTIFQLKASQRKMAPKAEVELAEVGVELALEKTQSLIPDPAEAEVHLGGLVHFIRLSFTALAVETVQMDLSL
jgi:hypothetical protein